MLVVGYLASSVPLEDELRDQADEGQQHGGHGVPDDRVHDAEGPGELTDDDDRDAEREVGDDVEGGDNARALIGCREREDKAQRPPPSRLRSWNSLQPADSDWAPSSAASG